MKYRIAKQFHFSASHQLSHLPEGHPCARLHGHNYVVELEMEAETLDTRGFVVDYNDLDQFAVAIKDNVDHRHLNDVLGSPTGVQTTAENLARYFLHYAGLFVPHLVAVRVSETPKTWAECRR